jgi:hypothetical protein
VEAVTTDKMTTLKLASTPKSVAAAIVDPKQSAWGAMVRSMVSYVEQRSEEPQRAPALMSQPIPPVLSRQVEFGTGFSRVAR